MVYIFNPSIWRQKLLDLYEFQAGLVSIASSRATWIDPVSETYKKKKPTTTKISLKFQLEAMKHQKCIHLPVQLFCPWSHFKTGREREN